VIPRLSSRGEDWKGFVLVHARFEAWRMSLSSGSERRDDVIVGSKVRFKAEARDVVRSAQQGSNLIKRTQGIHIIIMIKKGPTVF